jgi:hypothetical protein
MSRTPRTTAARRRWSRVLAVASVSLFALTAAGALLIPPAQAATNADWGSGGTTTSDSAVSVKWDNSGNSALNTVARVDGTVLPHTGGKTYADLNQSQVDWYKSTLSDLNVTVSQSVNLANQTVDVAISGVSGGTGNSTGTTLQVYQCWGTQGADGKPDPNATQPDPESCQSSGARGGERIDANVDGDLVKNGDWGELVAGGQYEIPFRAIDGTVPGGTFTDPDTGREVFYATRATKNPYFSDQTTNQLTVYPQAGGTAVRPFELQTTTEAVGLGCGVKADVPSVSRCWIVVTAVPPSGNSGLAPTAWANRVQVAVDFADIGAACPAGQSRALLAGSELLSTAMASWIPALCSQQDTALGYTVLGDAQVRRELDAGTRKTGVLSVPGAAESFTSPVALSATVIAYRIDHTNGAPLGQIKLNPRLVAKLLTESYNEAIDNVMGSQILAKAPWTAELLPQIGADPEFLALNPGAAIAGGNRSDLIASLTQSDAAAAVWDWVLADPEARAFLHGCPDAKGYVVNPFYSTRTYEECADQVKALETVAEERITATVTPDSYVYVTPAYPSDSAAFPQPGWYARDAVYKTDGKTGEKTLDQTALTVGDLHPRQTAFADVGRTVGRAVYPSNTTFCYTATDDTCLPLPGKWKSVSTPGFYGSRYAMGITDSVTAARFGMQTALLCATSDTTGKDCVGADTKSLQTAANAFVPAGSALGNGVSHGGTAAYDTGAYPLTLPVYASVAKTGLTEQDARAYAGLLEWFAHTGQTPGYASGQLPPGYAPLTTNLLALADTAVSQLKAWTVPVASTTPPSTAPLQAPVNAPAARPVASAQANSVAQSAAAASAGAVANPELVAKVGTTPTTESGFPQFALAGGLVAALVAGIASPLVGGPRRRSS